MSSLDTDRARRYLLARASENEAEALETRFFESGDDFEEVWGVENDLVDAYLAGELRPEDRSAFEATYLASPVHRDRLASARLLKTTLARPDRPAARRAGSRLAPLLALAACVLLALAVWWLRRPDARPVELAAVPTPVSATTPSVAPSVPASPEAPPRRPVVAAFALSPVLFRSNQQAPVLRVAPGTDKLALTLGGDVPEGLPAATRLPFAVATVEGDVVVTGRTAPGPTSLGIARVAAARLPPGDYILSVRSPVGGEPPLRQYYFRVLRR